MKYILLYWGFMLIGYFLGYKGRGKVSADAAINIIMTVSISALVFVMGMRMGSNSEVINNIGSIGLISMAITVILWLTAAVSVTIARRLLGIDARGRVREGRKTAKALKEQEPAETIVEPEVIEEAKGGNGNAVTWCIVIFVLLGIAVGFFWIRAEFSQAQIQHFYSVSSTGMTVGLCILLFFIGVGMGLSGTVVNEFKKIGALVFVIPVVIIVSSTIVGIIIGMVVPSITVRESLAITYGFGWYTFAPVAITGAGHAFAGAISFMHNIFREIFGVVMMTLLANKIGYLEAMSLPGSSSSDICIPIVQKVMGDEMMAYSFAIGITEAFLTTILVPLAIGA